MAMEVMEDDVLFADLSKHIALLIMDDDEEFPMQSPPVLAQGFHQFPQVIVMPPAGPPCTYDMMGYRRESKGTGVFIPRSSSLPRSRKNRSGKSTSNNNKNFQRHNDRSGVAASHVANST